MRMQELSVSYVMEEKPTIPLTWKALHLIFYFLACISGIFSSVFFHRILQSLDENCFLFTEVKFKKDVLFHYDNLEIDMLSTNWKTKQYCEFYLYSHLLCSIFSLVWMVFFMMCARGGLSKDGYIAQPWRIVTPSFIFNIIAFAITLNASIHFHAGTSKFCDFHYNRGKSTITNDNRLCHNMEQVYIDRRQLGIGFVHDVTNCLTTQWLNTIFWFMSLCWSMFRCAAAPDFNAIKITVLSSYGDVDDLAALTSFSNEEIIDIIEPSAQSSQDTIVDKRRT